MLVSLLVMGDISAVTSQRNPRLSLSYKKFPFAQRREDLKWV